MKSNKSFPLRIIVFLFVVIMVSLSIFLWWKDGVSPVNVHDTSPLQFSVTSGEGVRSIASRLAKQGLIRSPVAFFIYVKLHGFDRKLQAGDFRLNRAMGADTVANELTHGVMDTWVTIVEGWRDEEIAAKLSQDLQMPEVEFMKVAREGYMFPDTYAVPREASAAAVAAMMQKNFNEKVGESLRESFAAESLTLEQAVTLASIVEREGKNDTDRPIIAGILLNRLRDGIPLQVDATLQYMLGYQPKTHSWWKTDLTAADKTVNSPYNTYLHAGLPPQPICNPGLSSLNAVAHPTRTAYLYYIHDPQGTAHYATTLKEHTDNISKYLQ